MTEAVIDHLWQSTWFALTAALLILVFRGNRASVRFKIWLAASLKFLVPLPLFVLIAQQLHWQVPVAAQPSSGASLVLDQLAAPGRTLLAGFVAAPGGTISGGLANAPVAHAASSAAPTVPRAEAVPGAHAATGVAATYLRPGVWIAVLILWALGCAVLICRRLLQWWRLNSIAWSSSLLDMEAPLPVRATDSKLEPGLFGILWPVLLLPEGIAHQMGPEQLDTIIAHELHHWRRKDNLTAALHMIVETVFWFHPLVWWLGSRMIIERERAVDEAVVDSGSDRQVYAEGILKVCQYYVEPPLPCTAGVSGGTLRKRIEEIMTNRTLRKLNFAKKCLLSAAAAAGVGGPIAIGLLSAPSAAAFAQQPAAAIDGLAMKHYESVEWKFALDIPKHWNAFPPVSSNSPNEVIRFLSNENGTHSLIVFRVPKDPAVSATALSGTIQNVLATKGFGNFISGETAIGTQKIVTLSFDRARQDGASGTWHCIYYYFTEGALAYVLGFGTTNQDTMFPLYEKMARTFVSNEPST
jgi:beta-lactamase regulating signal transducer with metallopeptidase domain